MGDPRPRHAGRRSPTVIPARASMPVNIGYNLPYTGELHALPTTRYDAALPRRHEPKITAGANPPSTTITAYNAPGDPMTMTRSLSRSNRNRSSTVDSHATKPVIVTTSHARPHANSTHAPASARPSSPVRDPFRANDDAFAVQPASSIRARSHNRHTFGQGAPLGDEYYRLRERVGGAVDDRFWGPSRTSADTFRNPRPHVLYTSPGYGNGTAMVDYEDDYYEYTKPSELVRYDLDHDRDRRNRRESVDRPYYRPHVSVVNHDTTRYEPRNRTKPPPSAAMERFNRAAAAGAYDRPSVTMPAPPAVPPPPPIDGSRRPALLEDARSPSCERRTTRPRPVSLYQDGPVRPSLAEDLYRSRDDERVGKDRRERDDGYRDDSVTARGFGIRTETVEPLPVRPSSTTPAHGHDERRPRHDTSDRDSKRASDESLAFIPPQDPETPDADHPPVEEPRDRRNGVRRRESIGRLRDKVTVGGRLVALAAGLVPFVGRFDGKESPKQEAFDEDAGDGSHGARLGEASQSGEIETNSPKASPKVEPISVEKQQEPQEEHDESISDSEDETVVDVRDQHSQSEENMSVAASDRQDASTENGSNVGRRLRRPSPAFDPTDPKSLVDLKAEMAALDSQKHTTEAVDESETALVKDPAEDDGSDEENNVAVAADEDEFSDDDSADDLTDDIDEETRGREMVPLSETKLVRLVSPPRDKSEHKPIKGILKTPSVRFPEESNPIREGVAPHKDDQTKKDVPPGARWTKISRKKVNPEALNIGKERFEVRDDFVIVLRVLNKEEIQAYATATARIREMRRKEYERETKKALRTSDEEQTRSDEERQRRHRHRQEREDDEYRRARVADDRQRRHKHDDEFESRRKSTEYH